MKKQDKKKNVSRTGKVGVPSPGVVGMIGQVPAMSSSENCIGDGPQVFNAGCNWDENSKVR